MLEYIGNSKMQCCKSTGKVKSPWLVPSYFFPSVVRIHWNATELQHTLNVLYLVPFDILKLKSFNLEWLLLYHTYNTLQNNTSEKGISQIKPFISQKLCFHTSYKFKKDSMSLGSQSRIFQLVPSSMDTVQSSFAL